mmetsp:Transcript_2355/g.7200  ORF Transcript_2355/g.7200 Transcript_2355/m.7200 type:complete len:384 (+) Transcript_2355:203-1354(+)
MLFAFVSSSSSSCPGLLRRAALGKEGDKEEEQGSSRFLRRRRRVVFKATKKKKDDFDEDDIKTVTQIPNGEETLRTKTTTTSTSTHHFDRLVRQNRWMFPHPEKDANEDSLKRFWQSRGVKDREMMRRLIALGSGLAEMRLEDEMGREPATAALAARLDRMKVLFPTCDVNSMLWKKPEVFERSFKEITKAAIEWKAVLKDVTQLDVVVENNPQILLMTTEEIGDVGEGLEILRREFFGGTEEEENNNDDGEEFNDVNDVAFESKTTTTTTTTTRWCARDGCGETRDGWHAVRGEEHLRHPVRRSRGESGGYREPVFERDGRSRTKDENDARLHVVLVEGGWNEHVRVYAGMENKSRVRELDEHAGETSVALSSRSVPVFAER